MTDFHPIEHIKPPQNFTTGGIVPWAGSVSRLFAMYAGAQVGLVMIQVIFESPLSHKAPTTDLNDVTRPNKCEQTRVCESSQIGCFVDR